jgi:hypothetical protein
MGPIVKMITNGMDTTKQGAKVYFTRDFGAVPAVLMCCY